MNIKKYVSDTINVFGNVLSGIDNAFGKNRIYNPNLWRWKWTYGFIIFIS